MAFFRKFTKRVFIVSNIVVVIFFLLACTNAFIHPSVWWFVSLLGLIFPLLLLLVVGFLLFWLFFRSRQLCLISLVAILIGWQNIHAFFAFDVHKKFILEKPSNALRIMTWNVRGWDEFITRKPGASGHRQAMMDFIDRQNADLLCLQEFLEPTNFKNLAPNIEYIRDHLNYPYYFFSRDYRGHAGQYESGVIIFSRHPFIDSFQIKYQNVRANKGAESLLAVDVNVNGKKIRLYTTHLQSVLFQSKDFRNVQIIKNVDDSMLEASRSVIKKLKTAYAARGDQADLVRQQLDQSPYPAIVCGDFNDVPNSYTYFRIRGDWQDAYTSRGFGIGRTYVHISPTLRIDYIMASRDFNILQCSKFVLPYSDHHPVIADIQLP